VELVVWPNTVVVAIIKSAKAALRILDFTEFSLAALISSCLAVASGTGHAAFSVHSCEGQAHEDDLQVTQLQTTPTTIK
jgi:hypothetical protein